MLTATKVFLIQIILFFVTATAGYAADKLDPFSAEFTIISDGSSLWSDMSVTLDFKIHNSGKEKLRGSKFVCMEDIDSLSVTDGEGGRLAFTIKKFPRKRIVWDYGPAKQSVRRARISFIMRKAVKKQGGNYLINIDWIGGWKRRVLNAAYSMVFPEDVSKKDIISIYPKNYKLIPATGGIKVIHNFPELNVKGLKFVIKQKEGNGKIKKTKKSKKHILKNIRVARHSASVDRLVFELNKVTPYVVDTSKKKDEVLISWKVPLEIAYKEKKKTPVKSRFIKGLYWKKTPDKKMTCMVQLKKKNLRVRYGTLSGPPRAYIDICFDPKRKDKAEKKRVNLPAKAKKTTEKKNIVKLPKPVVVEKKLKPVAPVTPPVTTTTIELTASDKVPVEERIAYDRAQKFDSAGDKMKAIQAYEEIMRKFPTTYLKEKVFFEIADCYYELAEKGDTKKYEDALSRYKTAMLNFPASKNLSHALFRIAESCRKRELFSEAITRYSSLIKKHPESEQKIDARFWKAECLYQTNKYKSALKEFEKFVDEFPSSLYLKKASFRIADCYYKTNDFDRAEYYYEKALKKWPDMVALPMDTLNNLAMTCYYKGKFEKSRKLFFLSFNIYSSQENRERLLRFIGDAYQWEGQMQEALNIYGTLMLGYPDSYESMIGAMRIADLGVNVSGLESEKFTFKDFNPYLKPDNAYKWVIQNDQNGDLLTEAYYKSGYILAKKGYYPEAIRYFKQCMNQKGKGLYYKKSRKSIKGLLVNLINKAASERDYFSVVSMYEKNRDSFLKTIEDCSFYHNAGISYYELGFLEKAGSVFNDILMNYDDSLCRQKTTISLSRIDLQRGRPEKAEERLRLLLYGDMIMPSIIEPAYHLLGDAFYQGGRFKKAVEAYSDALKGKGKSFRRAKSLNRCGESFGRNGYFYSGIKTLKKLLEMDERTVGQEEKLRRMKDEARLLMVKYLFNKENFQSAVAVCKGLVESTADKEKKGWALFKWGEALMKTGDMAGASRVFVRLEEDTSYGFLSRLAVTKIEEAEWKMKF